MRTISILLIILMSQMCMSQNKMELPFYELPQNAKEIPFWNTINGPISDAIWHCGQIAVNRRTSGNPINPKVNHFSGTVSE